MRAPRFITLLKSNTSGVALIEFAIVLPLLLIMLTGLIEITYYILVNQKLDKVANSMADFATQGNTIGVTDLNNFAVAVPKIMQPYNFTGTVVFTSVANYASSPVAPCSATNTPCITWQHKVLGTDNSLIGSPGGQPTLPANYPVIAGQNIIVAEAYQHYQPLLASSVNILPAFTPQTLYKIAILKPRQGMLTTLGP